MENNEADRFYSDTNSEKHQLPAVVAKNEKAVKRRFWKKIARMARHVPFSYELLSAYYCSIDPETPSRVRAILLAALAYFVLPADLIPDFIVGVGFSDDATVLTAAISIVASHISDSHRTQAKTTLKSLADST